MNEVVWVREDPSSEPIVYCLSFEHKQGSSRISGMFLSLLSTIPYLGGREPPRLEHKACHSISLEFYQVGPAVRW